jgi:hypothetical protein
LCLALGDGLRYGCIVGYTSRIKSVLRFFQW